MPTATYSLISDTGSGKLFSVGPFVLPSTDHIDMHFQKFYLIAKVHISLNFISFYLIFGRNSLRTNSDETIGQRCQVVRR